MAGEETSREDRLGEVIAGYLRSLEAGKPADREELLRLHPDLAGDLRSFFANHDRMDRAARPIRDAHPVERLPRPFGRYTLQEAIGRGGMGIVYKAYDPTLKRDVALKTDLSGRFASTSEMERFRFEAEAAAGLDHPNIVPIYEVGGEEGQLYFTMKLLEKDSLERRLDAFREDPRKSAQLLLTLARAVRYAHQRAILHRDLKPGNVLLDSEGNPQITDFGLAKRMDGKDDDDIDSPGEPVGTLAYMAPEQTEAQGNRLSTSVDVYGLGAILYALLTGRRPFEGKNAAETLLKVRQEEPVNPRALNARVDADLAAICLKCLEKDPVRRYDSARSLAVDLENWLEGKPIQARPVGRIVRVWRWCRRKPALAGVIALATLLFLFATVVACTSVAGKAASRREILNTNVYEARGFASQVQLQLKAYSAPVLETAEQPALVDLLQKHDLRGLSGFLDRSRSSHASPVFESWFVIDLEGVMIARSPTNAAVGTNVGLRDYFRGTLTHVAGGGPREVHISSVYRSIANNLYMYAICAPIVDSDGKLLAVLAASLSTDDTLGLPTPHDERRKATLVGPFDKGRIAGDPPGQAPDWVIVVHEGVKRGEHAVSISDRFLGELGARQCPGDLHPDSKRRSARNASYADPFQERDPAYQGNWLAGYAPVGNTGFVVIIQQREE